MSTGTKSVNTETRPLVVTILILLPAALVVYGVGVWRIYAANCAPAADPAPALLGLAMALISSGVRLAEALISRRILSWVAFLAALVLVGMMGFLLFVMAVLRCSGT